ncbi:hypothetical protein [Streptomyces virginiae]|uniref:hypothetical protein n=1 Tax=Streptomyces virginiae TaxID=1961 RepID=UPI003F541814
MVLLNVDKLGALGEPKSLTWLRKRVEKMLPKIDLPDLLFEVNAWTGFLDAFVHLGDGTWDRAMIAFWVSSGVRASELIGVRQCDVDPARS